MTSISSPLLDTDVLPLEELLSLCLDGHLYRVGDAFATLDTPDGPELRARAFALSAPDWSVADRGSAAWIHGTRASPPPRPQVCVPPKRRGGVWSPHVDVSHRTLGRGDTMLIGPVPVTTPLRTASDLLSAPGTFGPAQALEARHLIAIAGITPAEFDQLVRASRRKGCGLARSRIPAVVRSALPEPRQPALTR